MTYQLAKFAVGIVLISVLSVLIIAPPCNSRDHGDRGGWHLPSGG